MDDNMTEYDPELGSFSDGTFMDEDGMRKHMCRIGGSDFLFVVFRHDRLDGDVTLNLSLGAEPHPKHGGGGHVEWIIEPDETHVLHSLAHMLHNLADNYYGCTDCDEEEEEPAE